MTQHPELPLDMRRAMANGHLGSGADGAASGEVSREVVVYTHLNPGDVYGIVDVEGPRG